MRTVTRVELCALLLSWMGVGLHRSEVLWKKGLVSQDPELLPRLLRAKDLMDAASHEKWPVRRLARVSNVSEAHFAAQPSFQLGLFTPGPPVADRHETIHRVDPRPGSQECESRHGIHDDDGEARRSETRTSVR
jgi:hypothetical protein